MRIVFINDHPFYVDSSYKIYTSGTLTSDVWNRFTDNFGDLTVIGRGIKLVGDHNHKSAEAEGVEFDLFYEIKGGLDYFRYHAAIEQKIKRHILQSDFVVIRLPSNIGTIAASLCKKYNKRYFVEVVGCAFDSMWYYGNTLGKLLAPFLANRNRNAIKYADAAVYVTKNYLQKRYPNNNPQIHASNVVLGNFDDDVLYNHQSLLRARSNVSRIGMIGNVALPYKGYKVLFKALAKLKCNFQLEIVGGGEIIWVSTLIQRYGLQGKVILKGRINGRDKINEFLDSLDLYVQPSLTEGLPRSVIEAMSRACPIIASDAGGIPELISSKFIYPRKDSKSLAILLNETLSNSVELLNASEENFIKSKEYTFDVLNKRRYDFFYKIKEQLQNI